MDLLSILHFTEQLYIVLSAEKRLFSEVEGTCDSFTVTLDPKIIFKC